MAQSLLFLRFSRVHRLCAAGQDFHQKLLSLCVDNQLAQTIFAGGWRVVKVIGLN